MDKVAADGDDGDRRLLVSYVFYIRRPYMPRRARRASSQLLYQFLLNKWYFDELYDLIFVRPAQVARPLPLEGRRRLRSSTASAPTACRRGCLTSPATSVRLQTGYLYHYAFAMLIGVAGLITWFMFGVGGQ